MDTAAQQGTILTTDHNDDQPVEQWDPEFANVTSMDPNLFRCSYLRMQNAANYDFTPEETARIQDKGLRGLKA